MSFAELRSGGFGRLVKKGQRLLRGEPEEATKKAKPKPLPSNVPVERRSGPRILLPLAARIKIGPSDPREVRVKDVNLRGLALVPADGVDVGERINVGFDGYPNVCPGFALVGVVRRIVPGEEPGEPSALGIEIDRDGTSADAQKNYRRLVLHYVRHRPLLEDASQGYFEGRCTSCDWVGRVGRRRPVCSRCGSKVVPNEEAQLA